MGEMSWADEVASRHGARLAKLRSGVTPAITQKALAERLEMDASWVSRVEKGVIALRSAEDVRTYALALGADADAEAAAWETILDEEFGVWPWPERVVLPGSFRRQGEERERVRKATRALEETELAPGVPFRVLSELVREDSMASAAIAAMCWEYERRSAKGGSSRS